LMNGTFNRRGRCHRVQQRAPDDRVCVRTSATCLRTSFCIPICP
jgi:hypothetical protein